MFGLSIYLFNETAFPWWWFPALILLPDVGILGYLVNTKVGAVMYNITHHKGIAVLVICMGWYSQNEWAILVGIILFGHSSMDRILGYGLKYSDSIKNTHLGWIMGGKEQEA